VGADAPGRPRPLAQLPAPLCRGLVVLFTDIDDTLTEDGLLPASSYQAVWDLARAGIEVVPVTGRPAGWCDHIARMWPVAGVIGENGAFHYRYDRARRRMERSYAMPVAELAAGRARLERIAERVMREVPGSAVAADQPFRISDYAIDFREDVPPLGMDAVDSICRILASEGVSYRVSSIHVNYWIGSFDKMSGLRRFLRERGAGDPAAWGERILFIGDSPNDEPMFAAVPHTVAVANIGRFLPRLASLPEFVTEAETAAGFVEAARAILTGRQR
jgi:HAD superfamily hydrolase (TIGR01484 family)